jgi:hypothetical protein
VGLRVAGLEAARSRLSFDAPSGPAGDLAAGGWCSSDDGGHYVEGELEDVVKDKHRSLWWTQLFEDDEQGHAKTVVEGDPVGWVRAHGEGRWRTEIVYRRHAGLAAGLRERSWSRQIRLTTTIIQPRMSSISSTSTPRRRPKASWTTSSAS